MRQTRNQQRFTISEVAADWHEPIGCCAKTLVFQLLFKIKTNLSFAYTTTWRIFIYAYAMSVAMAAGTVSNQCFCGFFSLTNLSLILTVKLQKMPVAILL